jgi:hypothetical protein
MGDGPLEKEFPDRYRGASPPLLVTYILKAIKDNLVTPSTCAIAVVLKLFCSRSPYVFKKIYGAPKIRNLYSGQ